MSLALRFAVIGALALALLAAGSREARPVSAFGVYPTGATGHSISFPQCPGALSTPAGAFGIVGVNGGRAFYQNPCLIVEYAWAQAAPVAPSLVMNLNAPSGAAAFKAKTGPRGVCAATDQACLAYNFGFNAAKAAFGDAQSQETTASTWWLDIETGNTWSADTNLNALTIQGAIDMLRAQQITVGVYSSVKQWGQIAGNFRPSLPEWVALAPDAATAPAYCSTVEAFAGGDVWLVQYQTSDYDAAYACGTNVSAPPPVVTPVAPPAAAPPAAPANVRATVVDASHVRLDWDPPAAPADSYGLYSTAGQPYVMLAGNLTTDTVAGLTPGAYYCFILYAGNRVGYSPWSNWACATLPSG